MSHNHSNTASSVRQYRERTVNRIEDAIVFLAIFGAMYAVCWAASCALEKLGVA